MINNYCNNINIICNLLHIIQIIKMKGNKVFFHLYIVSKNFYSTDYSFQHSTPLEEYLYNV